MNKPTLTKCESKCENKIMNALYGAENAINK